MFSCKYFVVLCAWILLFNINNHCGVIILSIPKCGTNLVGKLVKLLGYKNVGPSFKGTCLHFSEQKIAALGDMEYTSNHVIMHAENQHILKKNNHKVIFIYRDPRDQLISLRSYIKNQRQGIWKAEKLSDEEFITKIIQDYSLIAQTYKKSSPWSDPLLETVGSIAHFYNLYLPWMQHPDIYSVSFERLIGQKGGGDHEAQVTEIRNIGAFLGFSLTDSDINTLIDQLFGGVFTFNKGQIGRWKEHFTSDHVDLFKKCAGQLLIDLGYEMDLNW